MFGPERRRGNKNCSSQKSEERGKKDELNPARGEMEIKKKNNHKAQKNLETEISTDDEDIKRVCAGMNIIQAKWPRITSAFSGRTETTRFRRDDTGLRTETRGSSDPMA